MRAACAHQHSEEIEIVFVEVGEHRAPPYAREPCLREYPQEVIGEIGAHIVDYGREIGVFGE